MFQRSGSTAIVTQIEERDSLWLDSVLVVKHSNAIKFLTINENRFCMIASVEKLVADLASTPTATGAMNDTGQEVTRASSKSLARARQNELLMRTKIKRPILNI